MNHTSWDDEKNALYDMGLKGWLFMMMSTFNVLHGEYDTDKRYHLTMEHVNRLRLYGKPEEHPYFLENLDDVARECGIDTTSKNVVSETWTGMLWKYNPLRTKRYFCKLNRFHGFTEEGKYQIQEWYRRGFLFTTTSTEQEYQKLKQKKVKTNKVKAVETEGDKEDKSTANAMDVVARAIKGSCVNDYAIATYMYQELENLFRLQVIIGAGEFDKAWQGEYNIACRDVFGFKPWLLKQVKGGFTQMVASVFALSRQEAFLSKVGFTMPDERIEYEEGLLHDEYVMAQFAFDHTFTLGAIRLRRELHLFNWPARAVLMFQGDDEATEEMELLQEDYGAFGYIRSAMRNGTGANLDKWEERNVFKWVVLEQMYALAKISNFKFVFPFARWWADRLKRIGSSQLAEDGFNGEKTAARGCTHRQGKEQLAYQSLVEGPQIDEQHKFTSVKRSGFGAAPRGSRLEPSAYRASLDKCTVDLAGFVSRKQSAPWHQPTANNLMSPHCDAPILRYVAKYKCENKLGSQELTLPPSHNACV